MTLDELLNYLRLGGVTLALILSCSVLALGVAIERLLALWKISDGARELGERITQHLLRGDVTAARSAAERSDALAADIFLAGFERLDRRPGPDAVAAAVARKRVRVSMKL